ncbi:hypothetical protein CDCA_CDCA13G3559 [Cyanidium caldarium]|uniref:Bacterial surface antigen (D15) domain-containing protein n=1 Tax=Cyanidium caldarium TaxID=2771 RepID=A0AAV9IZ00_CYACA|nr:hypothetical protein CDCA_CDCA13G3559 [Cyanidium caldarium]
MKRLVLPRDLIHEVINELAAYNAADGEPIDYESIRQALTRLNAFYAEHGYRFHRVRRCDDQPIRDGVLELEAFEPQVARVVLRVVDDHDNECHRRTQTALVARALGYPGLEWEPTGDAKQLARQARRRRRAIKRPFRWTDWHFWRMHQIGLFKRMSVDAHLIPPPSTTDGATADVAPDAGDVEVVLTVQERSFRRFEPGITYSVGKLFGDVSYEDGNVGGNACRLRLDYKRQPGQEDNMLALEWDDPRIASAQGSYGLRLYESRDMQYGDRRGVSVTFASPPPRWARLPPPVPSTTTRQDHWLRRLLDVSERWAVHTGVSFEQVQESKAQARCAAPRYAEVVASMMATTDANGEATNHTNGVAASRTAAPPRLTFRQLLLTANIARDTRDDVLVPQGGHRASLTTSYAVPLRGMCAEYSRFTGTVSRYWAIPLRRRRRQQQQQPTKPPSLPRSNSGASADADAPARKNPCVAALADVRLASASLPPIEHHLLGGSGTVRGMDVGRLGRHASFARFSGELRLPIDDKSAVVAFADWATEVRLHRDASDAWARLRGGHRLGSGTTDSDTIPRASAASVGLGARVGGAMQIDCAWVVRPEGARPGKWLALDRAYWHVGMMDMNF